MHADGGGRGRCAPHVAIDPAVAVRPTSDVPLEHCFERADSLPIAAQSADSSWRITDEGKKKGLRKLGLLSRKQHVGYCRLSSAIAAQEYSTEQAPRGAPPPHPALTEVPSTVTGEEEADVAAAIQRARLAFCQTHADSRTPTLGCICCEP